MARRFMKRRDLGIVVLPRVGRMSMDQVVEGDEFARFCPQLLVEVEAPPAPKPEVKSAPAVKPSPKPVPAPAPAPALPPTPISSAPTVVPEPEVVPDEEPAIEWKKSDLVKFAGTLGLDVAGMTKSEILAAIQVKRRKGKR